MAIKHVAVVTHGQKGLASEWNADHTITSNVDFLQWQTTNQCIHSGVIFPVLPADGQIFYRTDLNTAYIYNGTSWDEYVNRGVVFPVAPRVGEIFYRTDLNMLYFWDATAWVLMQGFNGDMAGQKIINLATPTAATDAANKFYVDTFGPLGHARLHSITSVLDHSSAATSGRMLKADANGLPIDATNTDAAVSAAVGASHTQGTDTTLGSMTAAVNMDTHQINNLAAPSNPNDAARLADITTSGGVSVELVELQRLSRSGSATTLITDTSLAEAPAQIRAEVVAERIYTGTVKTYIGYDNHMFGIVNSVVGAWTLSPGTTAGTDGYLYQIMISPSSGANFARTTQTTDDTTYMQWDMGAVHDGMLYVYLNSYHCGANGYIKIKTSPDGAAWTTQTTINNLTGLLKYVVTDLTNIRYIRLTAYDTTGATCDGNFPFEIAYLTQDVQTLTTDYGEKATHAVTPVLTNTPYIIVVADTTALGGAAPTAYYLFHVAAVC